MLNRSQIGEAPGLREILDQLPVGIMFAEAPSGQIVFGNKQVEIICGHPVNYPCSNDYCKGWTGFHADGRQVQSDEYPMARTLATGERAELDVHYRRGDDTWCWIHMTSAPICDSNGGITGAMVALVDIDAQRRGSEELQRVRERLQAAISVAELGIWTWRVGDLMISDGNLATLFGLSEEQVAGGVSMELFFSRVYPEDVAKVHAAREQALASGGRYSADYRVLGKNDEVRWLAARGKATLDAHGKPYSLNGALLDITDRKRAEEALRESEERLRTLTDTLPQLIWSASADGRVDYLSEQWGEFTGRDQADLTHWQWEEIIHPDDIAETRREWVRCLQKGEPYEISQRLRHRSGEWRWILARARPIRPSGGQIHRWVGTCTDIHTQLITERELRRLNTDLESFSFAAAHDLQEPLRMVTSYTQLLARRFEGRLDDDEREMMEYVINGAKRISLLIQDLWAYTAVSRTIEVPKENVDLNRAFRRAMELLNSVISGTAAKIDKRVLPKVSGYEAQFVQLFHNLIDNAVKYRSSRPPEIKVDARREGQEWIVSVQDNGIGIDRQYHQQIFGIFKRLHSQQIPGTGIGLAICQRVVERSGGRIWVESAGTGHGSTFSFALPVAVGQAASH